MKLHLTTLWVVVTAVALPSVADAQASKGCAPIADASRAGLYVITGERRTAVEGSLQSAERRGDNDWRRLYFETAFAATKVRGRCATVGWRVEPVGPNPVNAADFGGRFPSGIATLSMQHEGESIGGEIELWVPDDRRPERPEQFRIVLLNPLTRQPLSGVVGRYDGERGVPVFRAPAATMAMANRLIMTVEDAPEQRTRR